MVYGMQLAYDELIDILDLKYVHSKRIGYSLYSGVYEKADINKILEFILPDNVKVSITGDDIGKKSFLKTKQNSIFTEKSFFTQY